MPDSERVSQGGPANFARLFVSHMESQTSHRWVGVMCQGGDSDRVSLEKVFSYPASEYHRIHIPKNLFRRITRAKRQSDPALIMRLPIKRLASLIKERKPDVVFLNGFGLVNWMLLKAAEAAGVPAVIQHAGIWTKELRLHRHLYSSAGLKMMEEMEKDSTRLTAAEVFLNTWSRDYYRARVARRGDDATSIIPLPFNFASFRRNMPGRRRDAGHGTDFNIGTIARWDEIKNHKRILSLARAAKRAGLSWRFSSVTEIPDDRKRSRQKRAYKKEINVIPALDRPGIAVFCRTMDLLILPSLFDVSPTVVLEAVAAGTPIAISRNVGYTHEFERSGAKDWVVDFSSTPRALAQMKKLAYRAMPQALRRRIMSAHEHDRVFRSYLDLFHSVIGSSKMTMAVTAPCSRASRA